ncbi:MAG: hypothetical protein RJB66_2643 [Pseudomonadota bacterium]
MLRENFFFPSLPQCRAHTQGVVCFLIILHTLASFSASAPMTLPVKKDKASSDTVMSLRGKAEQELSLEPLQAKIKSKANHKAPLQVRNLPTPLSIVTPTFTEAALTFSTVSPGGAVSMIGKQTYDLSQVASIPVISAQIQRWLIKDDERGHQVGILFGTGVGEKNIHLQHTNGYTLSNVEILYMNLHAGISLEKSLIEDTLRFGLTGSVVEELWQQNGAAIDARWSRWNPALALNAQTKIQLSARWYSLLELHKQWPLAEKPIATEMERFHLGFGYDL